MADKELVVSNSFFWYLFKLCKPKSKGKIDLYKTWHLPCSRNSAQKATMWNNWNAKPYPKCIPSLFTSQSLVLFNFMKGQSENECIFSMKKRGKKIHLPTPEIMKWNQINKDRQLKKKGLLLNLVLIRRSLTPECMNVLNGVEGVDRLGACECVNTVCSHWRVYFKW